MPITKLSTYEGVPIGKENFEEYTEYLNALVARSNPFIETTINDLNEVIVLGSNQVNVFSSDNQLTNFFTIETLGGKASKFFSFRLRNTAKNPIETINNAVGASDVEEITPGDIEDGNYLVRVTVSADSGATITGRVSVQVNSTDSDFYDVSATDILASAENTFYFPISVTSSDRIYVNFEKLAGSGNLNFTNLIYKYENWQYDTSYVINYKLFGPVFTSGLVGRVNVYYGNEKDIFDNVIQGTDSSLISPIDSLIISANNDTLGSLVFRPDSSDAADAIIFIAEVADAEFSIPVDVDVYSLTNENIVTLTGNSRNSFAFISNDDKELFAIKTNLLKASDQKTPGVRKWEIPMASVSELFFAPGNIGYGFVPNLMPEVYTRFSGSSVTYENAKTNGDIGTYEKGFVLATINGIPQVHDDQITRTGFVDFAKLQASDIYDLKSLRLGSEYPVPKYTRVENHQYARQVIEGFTNINSAFTFGESLGSPSFDNTLFFPFTDFLLNPTLILIHKNTAGVERYYFIPKDEDFSPTNEVKINHYKVIDPSSGRVKFNFNLGLSSGGDNRFWIVSAEQLTESTTNNVTDYFSSYGKLYAPTANINVSTKILSFDPLLILDTDLEFNLPEIPLIPSTKIISSSGGPIISDAEEEFSRFVIFAISYPGQILADEFVRIQANKFEPDVFAFYYYCGTSGSEILASEKPRPIYIKLTKNDISWYNRGINRVVYDPVSRAVLSELCLIGNTLERPIDGVRLQDLKRRTTLASLAGIIGPQDTTFMAGAPRSNSFLFGNSQGQIDSVVPASSGSILVGGTTTPEVLNPGEAGYVLTSTGTTSSSNIIWDRPRPPALTSVLSGSTLISSTDRNVLQIDSNTSQISISLSNNVGSTDVRTSLFFALSSDVQVNNLEIVGSVSLPVTGVLAGSYGTAFSIPRFTVASDGRISAASDISIDTNAWKFIHDGVNTITATSTDTLIVSGTTNQTVVTVSAASGTDVLTVALSTDVSIAGRFTTPVLRVSQGSSSPSGLDNGDFWNTSSGSFVRINDLNRQIAFVGEHTHSASDVTVGTLLAVQGGTGYNVYENGDLLIGNSLGTLSKSKLTVDAGTISLVNGSGSISLSVVSTDAAFANTIVRRNANGSFSANEITATLLGNASTSTRLQTARTINNVAFDGTENIVITAGTAGTLTAGFGLRPLSYQGLTSSTIAVATDTVMALAGAQTITGAKSFTQIISGNISGNSETVTNGVYTLGDQTISGVKSFFRTPVILDASDSLVFSNSSTTKRGVLGTVANGDQWFIGGGGSGSDNGFLEIATGDNGNEPIFVRQYTGGSPLAGSIARTLTLLDASGNSSLPGSLSISGNISSAQNITFGTDNNKATLTYTTNVARTYTVPDAGANASFVMTEGTQTINGAKTFGSIITGSITGNAGTVTNGVYTTGNQTIGGVKTFSSTITGSITGNAGTVTNGVYTTGDQTIGGVKTFSSTITGSITGNAGTVTNGVYTTGNQTIGGNKTFSNIVAVSNAGTLIIPIK
jgi:hypothetical protein